MLQRYNSSYYLLKELAKISINLVGAECFIKNFPLFGKAKSMVSS